MESENEISTSSPPKICSNEGTVKQSNAEAPEDLRSTLQVLNQASKDEEETDLRSTAQALNQASKDEEETPQGSSAFTRLPFDNSHDPENSKEVFSFGDQSQNSTIALENKMKSLESENNRLVEDLTSSKDEVSGLKRQLQGAREDNDKLASQLDGLKERLDMLEKQLANSNEKTKEVTESLSEQIRASEMELATKTQALESVRKMHSDLQLELQEVQNKSQDDVTSMKDQISNLEGILKSAQNEIEEKKAAASLLQAENANLKCQTSEISVAFEERSKQLVTEHQEELKVHENRCEDLHKSVSELEERSLKLQDSLAAVRSEEVAAREKVSYLELEQAKLSRNKNELEQGTLELQLQLKSMEEKANEQENSLKAAVEKLKASGEEASSLQQQLADVMLKEARSAEHLKDVEEGAQKLQLELQSKIQNLQTTISEMEEKATQLENLLSDSDLDREGARKKAGELEVELESLHKNHGELSEKVKMFEDKCSQHESTALTSSERITNLEEMITEYKSKADVMNSKVATLDANLLDSQNRATDLELQLKLAKDTSVMLEERSDARITELEENFKEYVSKNEELQKMLAERQNEIDSSIDKMNELKLSIGALESDLRKALDRELLVNDEKTSVGEELAKLGAVTSKLEAEKHELEVSMQQHISLADKGKTDLEEAFALEKDLRGTITTLQETASKLQGLLIETEEEKQATAKKLESLTKSFAELNDQLVEERQQLQQEIATVMQENEDLRHKIDISEEKLHVALTAEELSAKQVQEGFMKASTLTGQLEDLKAQLQKAHDTCANLETLEQEKGVLAQEFASAQEKLHAMFGAAEISARELEAASLTETTLKAEAEELKVQLEKAMDACSQVARLEHALQNSISREEHQEQIDKMLSASRLAESNLADLEEQLRKSKLEMQEAQISNNQQKTHLRDLPSDSDFGKVREMDTDLQNPGKARMRKKKGVTWESDLLLQPKTVQKPSHHLLNSYVAMMLVAMASLMTGFWLANKVQF